jgi:choline dehydrogenase-like flavoprotein
MEPVGSSFHAGGTLPMRATPRALETVRLGRSPGLSRVHVVDASVLPSIPATTMTYSVMANAHPIATES